VGIATGGGGGVGLPVAGDVSEFCSVARGFGGRFRGGGFLQNEFRCQCGWDRDYFGGGGGSVLSVAAANADAAMMYQLGWSTLPGLRGLSCSEFRAAGTSTPDNESGVAVEFSSETQRNEFLQQLEEHFAARRFTNAADAFDTVKAYVLSQMAKG
jgi:hypothetical protein